jgi:sugar phosphate isomerase/epimerase
VAFRAQSIDEVASLAADAGLEGIEWGGDVHVPPGDGAAMRRARDACSDAGLDCPTYGSYLVAGRDDEHSADLAIQTAVDLGATTIRVWAGTTGSSAADARQREAVADTLRAWGARAAAAGTQIGLEYHAGTLTDSAASTLALLDAVDSASVATYWQPRDGDAGADDLAELSDIGARLAHVHVFWWRTWLARFPLAEGEHFWREALAAVAACPGRPAGRWAHIEFVRGDDPDQLRLDARALRSWLA